MVWTGATLRYVRDGSAEPRIIESAACGSRERSWWDLIADCFLYPGVDLLPGHEDVLVTPDDLANSPLLEEVEIS